MTDLSTKALKRLLEQAAPGPWHVWDAYEDEDYRPDTALQLHDVDGEYLGLMHLQNPYLAALAPDLAQEVLQKREALHDLSEVWEAVSIDPARTPAEQDLAAAVVDHIDQILGDHDG